MIVVIIPARYASQRLPAKALCEIGGVPMVVRTLRHAEQSGWATYVACDDARIVAAVEEHGGRALFTSSEHSCGTSRLYEAAQLLDLKDDDLVVNVQGDEPMMPPECIQRVVQCLQEHPKASVATLATPFRDLQAISSPMQVKVVCDEAGRALYFSRAVIPYARSEAQGIDLNHVYLRHLGIYAYRVHALREYCALPASSLEEIEKLEQLRFLNHDMSIQVDIIEDAPPPGVDTEQDLLEIRRLWQQRYGNAD